ncbi:hypothetical protein EC988_008741, partial [Linderina pennispora]
MEIQIVDSSPPLARRPTMRLASEFRTLSYQLTEPSIAVQPEPHHWRMVIRELLNELVPLRSAHLQRQSDENQRAMALRKVADQLRSLNYHLVSVNDIYNRFSTSPVVGLEKQAVDRRVAKQGRNVFSRASRRIPQRLLRWFFGGFNRFLWVSMIVFWLCWRPIGNPPQASNLAMAIVIILVIILQASF